MIQSYIKEEFSKISPPNGMLFWGERLTGCPVLWVTHADTGRTCKPLDRQEPELKIQQRHPLHHLGFKIFTLIMMMIIKVVMPMILYHYGYWCDDPFNISNALQWLAKLILENPGSEMMNKLFRLCIMIQSSPFLWHGSPIYLQNWTPFSPEAAWLFVFIFLDFFKQHTVTYMFTHVLL